MADAATTLYGFEIREQDRRRADGPRSWDIKQLWQRQHEILALALQGHSHKDIAQILNVTPATVSNAVNSTLGKEKLSELRQARDENYLNISERIAKLTKKALDTYEQIFDNPGVDVKLKKETADTVALDMAGHRAPTKIDSRSINTTATLEEIEEFKRRGVEAARNAGMIVETEKLSKD